jgi:hypothetical protein
MEVFIPLADYVRYRSEMAVKKLFRWRNVSAILHFSSGIQEGFLELSIIFREASRHLCLNFSK